MQQTLFIVILAVVIAFVLFLHPFPTFGGMSDTEQNEQETDFTMHCSYGRVT